jgi:UDP-N-acetylmuramyl pentapeptide synthase
MKKILKQAVVAVITWEAKLALRRYKPKIAAVVGSVGKTSTKDAIYTVISGHFFTRKSQKSFNNDIAIPLTILGLPNAWSNPFLWLKNMIEGLLLIALPHKYPEWLVLEIGADRPGDIEKISKWIRPDVVVITRFGDVPVHIEFFPSIEDLVNEKGSMARALKRGGTLILNHDDKRVMDFADSLLSSRITYGFSPGADVVAGHDRITYGMYDESDLEFPYGIEFRIDHAGNSIPISLQGAIGHQHIYPYAAAFAVGTALGINSVAISEALAAHIPPNGRMRLLPGVNDTLIIDDTYNSSPVAVQEGLKTLRDIVAPGRKIAILGDMMELGEYSKEEHQKMGEMASKVVRLLVTVGIRSRVTAAAALDAGLSDDAILQFDDSQEAGQYMSEHLKKGDIIFIKGSQAARMERTTEQVMEHREEKEKLLVRQDAQWINKR